MFYSTKNILKHLDYVEIFLKNQAWIQSKNANGEVRLG